MRTRNLVQRTHRRFLPLPPGPVVLLIMSVCLAFGANPARAIPADLADYGHVAEFLEVLAVAEDPAQDVCSQWVSSGSNDTPMLGMLVSMEWDYINQVYVGIYMMDGGDQSFRRFSCYNDGYVELDWP